MGILKLFLQPNSNRYRLLSVMTVMTALVSLLPFSAAWTGSAEARALVTGMIVQRDIPYVDGGSRTQSLDLYLPQGLSGARPLIIWVHGGSWSSGDKNPCPAACFVGSGYAVASINYRLSGQACFPAQIDDLKAAVTYLRVNARNYKLDPNRFGVWGASAGGHLAALLGTAGCQPGSKSNVQAACIWSAPTNFNSIGVQKGKNNKNVLNPPSSPVYKLLGANVTLQSQTSASPIAYVNKNSVPFMIVHGDKDSTVPYQQSYEFYSALKQQGVSSEMIIVPGAGHNIPAAQVAHVLWFFNRVFKVG